MPATGMLLLKPTALIKFVKEQSLYLVLPAWLLPEGAITAAGSTVTKSFSNGAFANCMAVSSLLCPLVFPALLSKGAIKKTGNNINDNTNRMWQR